MSDSEIIIFEKHSFILRCTHWINVVLLSLMIWSGILIYWANDEYITIPDQLAKALSINGRLGIGLGWHFFIMWPFLINGLVYLTYMIVSGEWRSFIINKQTFKDAIQITLYELKIKKEMPVQIGKFNAAQRITYAGVILMAFGSIVTGLAIYKPVTLGWLTFVLGGYKAARLEHFIFMIGFKLFVVVHIIQVVRSGWNNFRAMIAGYEIEKN